VLWQNDYSVLARMAISVYLIGVDPWIIITDRIVF